MKVWKSFQMLNEDFIRTQAKTANIKMLPIVDSTNQYLLEHMEELHSGDTCIAEYQHKGRGRYGRKWFSPFGVNIYLSMYWHLKKGFRSAIGLSLVIGIVVVEILQKFGATQARVKWPNDIYLQDRKLAGILVELSGQIASSTGVIIGIGINLAMHSIQIDCMNRSWISLHEVVRGINRNLLVAQVIKELRSALVHFEKEGIKPFLPRWEQLDNFINCPVKLTSGNKIIYGISRGINSQGALMLEERKGIIKPWIGNEISLHSAKQEWSTLEGMYGYKP